MNVDRLPDEMPESSLMGCLTMVRMEPQPRAMLNVGWDECGGIFYSPALRETHIRPKGIDGARPHLIDGVWYWMA